MRDHQRGWDDSGQVLTYAYNSGIHSSTNRTPFNLVLSRLKSDLTISGDTDKARRRARKGKEEWVLKMAETVARSGEKLKKAQVTYNKTFDHILRHANANIKEGYHVLLYIQDGNAKGNLG